VPPQGDISLCRLLKTQLVSSCRSIQAGTRYTNTVDHPDLTSDPRLVQSAAPTKLGTVMAHDDPYREAGDPDRTDSNLPDDVPSAELPLREAARDLVKDTPEGRALKEKLEAFDKLDDTAKEKAAREIRKDLADIIARAVTEVHQRTALLDALSNFRNDQTLAASEPSEIQEQHPLAAQLLDIVEDVLAELGEEMLIEALLPGAHVLLPPTDFVDSLFTAVTMLEIAEIEDPFWPP
jgi:hypothetical protein